MAVPLNYVFYGFSCRSDIIAIAKSPVDTTISRPLYLSFHMTLSLDHKPATSN